MLFTLLFLSVILHDLIHQTSHAVTIDHDCECGLSNEGMKRIVGGRQTSPHQYPWTVAIVRDGNMHCGGALINDRYVLSAGHCIKWTKIGTLRARLGLHHLNRKEGLTLGFSKGIIHEDFTSDYLHDVNDIALLKLERQVSFSSHIYPVCLPHPMSEFFGARGLVAGWGRMGEYKEPSDVLLAAHVFVMTPQGCAKTPLAEHLTDTMMCAYNTNVDACQGDSGGPLIYEQEAGQYEIIGIVSWGIGCAKPGLPGVYTKVTSFLDWIAIHTSDAIYCKS